MIGGAEVTATARKHARIVESGKSRANHESNDDILWPDESWYINSRTSLRPPEDNLKEMSARRRNRELDPKRVPTGSSISRPMAVK
jgi:hypothetical protein